MKFSWRLILQLHIYLGLFCLPFFIIFSLSSLNFNHHFLPKKPIKAEHRWDASLRLPPQENLEALSDQLLDSLNLFGWFLPWDSYQDSLHTQIAVSQPGKKYFFHIDRMGNIKITEQTESIDHILKSLHFLGEDIPHAPWWVNTWKLYQSLTVYAMLFWVVSGIYLWLRKSKRPKLESMLMWGMSVISILFIILIWLIK